jgi:PilZ domain
MEHRLSARVPVHGRAIVDGAPIGIAVANVRDISAGGMFVECGPDSFPVDSLVALSFSLSSPSRKESFLITAMVVRADGHGVGFMFVDDESNHVAALHDLIFTEQPASLRSSLAFTARGELAESRTGTTAVDGEMSRAG